MATPRLNLFQINLFVRDFDRMLRFYRDQLGLDALDIDPGPPCERLVNWVSLSAGSVTLELFDAAMFGGPTQDDDSGRDAIMLAFIVDDVRSTREELRGSGIELDDVVEESWGRYATFRDPEGNSLQLYEVNAG